MAKIFEDEFMDIQSQIISLCLELVESKASKVYAYGSIEENSISFNAFFEIDGKFKLRIILFLTQMQYGNFWI